MFAVEICLQEPCVSYRFHSGEHAPQKPRHKSPTLQTYMIYVRTVDRAHHTRYKLRIYLPPTDLDYALDKRHS